MIQQKKHIEFDGEKSVDFEKESDGDIAIYLHIGMRNLDRVSGSSSDFYLRSYFTKYGFDADNIWFELQLFKGLTNECANQIKVIFAEPKLLDDTSLPLENRILRSMDRLDTGKGIDIDAIAIDLHVEKDRIAKQISLLLQEVKIYRVNTSHYRCYQ